MRRRAALLSLALGLVSFACSGPPEVSPPPNAPRATSAEAAPPPVEKPPALRQGATFPPPKPYVIAPPRVVDVASACSGPELRLDATFEPCACQERDERLAPDGHVMVRAGTSCGAAHADEAGPAPKLTLTLEKPTVAPGGVARVTVTLENDGPRARRYRVADRRLAARLVHADGTVIPVGSGWDGSYREEALFALPPGGKAVLVLEAGTSAWTNEGKGTLSAPLPRGPYAVEVRLGSLGGTKLLPIEVR